MPVIAWYLLKLSVSIAVIYLFYQVVLRRLTFYTWNRWYLLGYSLVAFWISLVNINPILEKNQWSHTPLVAFVPVIDNLAAAEPDPEPAYNAWDALWLVLLTGILIMGVRLLLQYISFRHIRRSAQLLTPAPVKVYQVNRPIVPFSFGRSVFINRHQHNEDELKKIISHEFIHVKQKHTVDILWAEVLCMLNWYNPFAWMLRKSIRQNLEFIADNNVLENGIDKKEYQYLLLKVVGLPSFSITPQFNIVSLKKRIAMMNKIKSARIHLFRFLFVLPLAIVMLLAFRNSQDMEVPAPMNTLLPDYMVEPVQDTVPKKVQQVVVVKPALHNSKGYRLTVADNAGECVVIVKDKKENIIKAIQLTEWDKHKAHFEALYGTIPPAAPSKELTKRIFADSIIYIREVDTVVDASLDGPGAPSVRLGDTDPDILYVVDGVIKNKKELDALSPNDIVDISVLKDNTAVTLYGEQGKQGVILITTTKAKQPAITFRKREEDGTSHISFNTFEGLFIVDGKEYDSEGYNNLFLKSDRIESVQVIKDKDAAAKYGAKGAKGVIIITTKKETVKNGTTFHFTREQLQPVWDYARKENLLYIGVENPLYIKEEGISPLDLEMYADQGRISKKDNHFYCVPFRPGKIKIEVFKKRPDGKLIAVNSYTYNAGYFPPPNEIFGLLAK
jgi:TonB-dependent SusC/RagA subfamily outer membrane receptor